MTHADNHQGAARSDRRVANMGPPGPERRSGRDRRAIARAVGVCVVVGMLGVSGGADANPASSFTSVAATGQMMAAPAGERLASHEASRPSSRRSGPDAPAIAGAGFAEKFKDVSARYVASLLVALSGNGPQRVWLD